MRSFILALSLLLIGVFSPLNASAAPFETQHFAKLPVMHEGRVKPMESFARGVLKQLSGHETEAMAWLMEALFNPALSERQRVLRITNPALLNLLQLEKRKDGLFSHREIGAALAKQQDTVLSIAKAPENTWTPAQKNLIDLQTKHALLGDILSGLSAFLPMSITIPEGTGDAFAPYQNQVLTYAQTKGMSGALNSAVRAIIKRKGENIERYSESEQALAALSFARASLRAVGEQSRTVRIIPMAGEDGWFVPWQLILDEHRSAEIETLLSYWQDMALAYHAEDEAAWQRGVAGAYESALAMSADQLHEAALSAENLYNLIKPFHMSAALYGLCLALLLSHSLFKSSALLTRVSVAALISGASLHALGIALRIFILQRPPVSTLYESIIFVGLVAVLYGLAAYRRDRSEMWVYLAAGLGITLHIISLSYNQNGDDLMMLSAVLNTNFWLATHVICISIGYGFCVVSSGLAHYALIKNIAIENTSAPDRALFKHLHTAALMALLFATVGTVLGGIWADQSWGRFWGWDPKENGALLIVLWLIWLIHGRICGQMNTVLVTGGLAYLSVIVALSWFGVNLLSVGLHSYGFTDSAALGLGAFIGAETLLIGGLLVRAHMNKQGGEHAA